MTHKYHGEERRKEKRTVILTWKERMRLCKRGVVERSLDKVAWWRLKTRKAQAA